MGQISDIIRDSQYPKTAQNLLNRLWHKEKLYLTLNQFLTECAYWALKDGFDELRPKQYPYKPEKVIEYQAIPLEKRLKLKPRFFEDNPEILKWYRQKIWVDNQNRANLLWLKEIQQHIPKEDILSQAKIRERILEFESK